MIQNENTPVSDEDNKNMDIMNNSDIGNESEQKKKKEKKKEKKVLTPEKKRRRRKRIILLVVLAIILVIVAGLVYSSMQAGKAPTQVTIIDAKKGNIEQTVSTSGTVDTDEAVVYYANVTATVDSLNVKTGDAISKGDILLTYDASDLKYAADKAALSVKEANGTYSDSMQKDSNNTEKYNTSSTVLPEIQAQLDALQEQIDAIQDKIDEKKSRMAKTATELQKTLLDVDQDGKEDGKSDLDANPTEDNGTEKTLEIQQSIKDNAYAQENDAEIKKWNSEISDLKKQKEDLTEQKSDTKSDKTTGEAGKLTDGNKTALAATRQTAELAYKEAADEVSSASKGITADFNGIVTDVKTGEGAATQKGTELFTIKNTEKTKVTINVTKYDLAKIEIGQKADITIAGNKYNGEISRISKVATTNESGASTVATDILIDNPDENIILGTQADVIIHTASKDNVIVLPIETINTDTKGTFVYVMKNGICERRDVKTGISTDTEEEITEGLSEGDQVISDITGTVTAGMAVAAAPVDASNGKSGAASSDNAASMSSAG